MDPLRRDDPPSALDLPGHDPGTTYVPVVQWQPVPKFQDRVWLHVLLLVLTVGTTTYVGVGHYLGFLWDFGAAPLAVMRLSVGQQLIHGLWYSGTILAILGCHELGHYFACRYYDVDASLPFFLPVPPPFLTGTLGAFIRIREPIPSKRILFDIGIAGPIAGFLVAVPALFVGFAMSHVSRLPSDPRGLLDLGEPLLFKLAGWVFWGTPATGYSIDLHPVAFASWFGLLATALNLFPIGQLDGGHICYAVLGRRSTYVTYAMIAVAIVLTTFSASWMVWTGLMILMLWRFGPHHPRTFDEDVPLDRPRLALAFFALVMFILCFTPTPLQPAQFIGR